MSELSIGAIDIGATKVLVALADPSGPLRDGQLLGFATPRSPPELIAELRDAFAQLADGRAAPLAAVGCAVPGPLSRDRSTVLSFHNRQWSNLPLRDLLGGALGVPIALEDDATAGALGEAVAGAGAGCDPVAYLTISSGIGAGLVVDGKPLRGAHGLAGEVGHLVLDGSGPACGCGLSGDVEAYAGGHAIARRADDARGRHRTAQAEMTTAEDVFAAARSGDVVALEIVADARDAVARVLAILMATIDPERIVIGGSVALAQPEWVTRAVAQARLLCHQESGAAAEVVPALLGIHSALAGAALIGARRQR